MKSTELSNNVLHELSHFKWVKLQNVFFSPMSIFFLPFADFLKRKLDFGLHLNGNVLRALLLTLFTQLCSNLNVCSEKGLFSSE